MFKYKGNNMALQCADCIIEGHAPFTALYLYGPSGCGKTALLNYIENESYLRNPNRLVIRITNDILGSLEPLNLCFPEDEYILMVDEIERFSTPQKIQLASILLSYLDKMNNTKNKIVITADRPIDDMQSALDDFYYWESLFDRLKWEMPVRLQKPTQEDCINALYETLKSIHDTNASETDIIVHMIAEAEGYPLGSALATLRRIIVRAKYLGEPVNAAFAEKVIYENADIELISA